MKVFLAGIIQGSLVEPTIHGQDWREPIKSVLNRHAPQADVYCHYSEHPQSIGYDLDGIRQTFAEGNRRAADCDLLIAYLPSASMGSAIEMHEAYAHGAAIVTISPMAANWVIRAYSDRILPDIDAFRQCVASGQLAELAAAKRNL